MPPRRVEVRIERLVLRGFAAGTQHALVAALERELAAGLAGGAALQDAPRLRLGTLPLAAGLTPAQVGAAVGARIARGIAPPGGEGHDHG